MKKKKHFITKGKTILFLSLALLANLAQAQRTINCADDDCLEAALLDAKPGDEIVLKAGVTFIGGSRSAADNFSAFWSDKDGEPGKPIILRGESSTNKPTISANRDGYSWYGINLTGDYWVMKDFIVRRVNKGIVLDGSNNCELIDLEVFDIGQEAIHLRTGSSNNLIKGCLVRDTGKRSEKDKGFGEGIYVGSDRKAHGNFDPNCNNNIIEDCVLGPNITADTFDIKEGTEGTVIRNNTFFASGITGANSGDSFIDLKGTFGYVYGNTFNVLENADALNAIIDVSNRTFGGYDYKTGTHSAIFENTINLSSEKGDVPTARIILDPEKQPLPSENVHVWENTRNSSKAENIDALTLSIVETACPEWNAFRTCSGAVLSTFDAELKAGITMYPNPVNDVLYIKGDKVSSINQVYINSLHGKELYKAVADNLDLGIDVSTLPNGLYIITLVTDAGSVSEKFIKN